MQIELRLLRQSGVGLQLLLDLGECLIQLLCLLLPGQELRLHFGIGLLDFRGIEQGSLQTDHRYFRLRLRDVASQQQSGARQDRRKHPERHRKNS